MQGSGAWVMVIFLLEQNTAVLLLLGIRIFELALKVTCTWFCYLVRREIGVHIEHICLVLSISWVFSLSAKLDGALI